MATDGYHMAYLDSVDCLVFFRSALIGLFPSHGEASIGRWLLRAPPENRLLACRAHTPDCDLYKLGFNLLFLSAGLFVG